MGLGVIRYKIWYDLWENKGRTLRVVAIIAVGAFAIGVTIGGRRFLVQDIARTWQESAPATIGLGVTPPVDESMLASLEKLRQIERVEGWQQTKVQWRPGPNQPWQAAILVAIDDYEQQTIRKLRLDEGDWPQRKLMGVQRGRGLVVGDQVELEIGDKIQPVQFNGILYNAAHPPAFVSSEPMFFTTRERFTQLTGERRASLVLATIPHYSDERVLQAADLVQHELEKQGIQVEPAIPAPGGFSARTSHPDRFIVQDALDGVFLMLTIMAVATLLLGLLLVYNTINAIVLQQVNQIGIMKAIGARTGQILAIYFSTVFVYGLLAALIAVPLGGLGAYGLRLALINRINMIPGPFGLSTEAILAQVAIAILSPLLISTLPILSGVRVTVREAVTTYGLGGTAGLLDRLLSKMQRIPRLISLTVGNTFRNKRRAFLTQITLVGAGIIFMMVTSTRTSLLHTFSDVLFTIFDSNIMLDLQDQGRIEEVEALALSHPEVKAVELWSTAKGSARRRGQAEANDDSRLQLRGVPLPSATYVPQIRAGRWLRPDDDYAIVLNQELAEAMGVGVGDWITLTIPGKRDSNWLVVGLVFEPIDQDSALMPRPTLVKELRQVGRSTAIRIQLRHDDPEYEFATVAELRALFETYGFSIKASNRDTAQRMIIQRTEQMSILIALLSGMAVMIAVVGAIALSGTLSINVLERTREIGVMRAIGASALTIAGQFVGEGLLLGWLSWLLAIPLSLPVSRAVVNVLSLLMNVDLVYQFSAGGVVAWLVIVTLLAVIASWFPAQKAAQTSVRESLAYV
jgi:putative ABC transport system permease protein